MPFVDDRKKEKTPKRKILYLQSLSVSRSSHRGRVDLLLDSVPVCLR